MSVVYIDKTERAQIYEWKRHSKHKICNVIWKITYIKNFKFKKFMLEKQLLDINISVTDLIYNLPIIAFVW